MTPEIMWSLLVSIGAIAVGAVLDAVKHRRELHLANEELSSSRKQLDVLKQNHNESISNLVKLNFTEKAELIKRISDLEEQLKSHNAKPLHYPKLGGSL